MEFLKDVLGERYEEFCSIINKHNEDNPQMAVEIINKASGEFTESEKYNALCEKYEKDTKDLAAKIEKVKFDSDLELCLNAERPKNIKALKALLDLEKIEYKDGEFVGLSEQLEKLRKEEAYLFAQGDMPQFTRPVSGADGDITRDDFKKLSYMEKLKLKKEAPKLFSKLK